MRFLKWNVWLLDLERGNRFTIQHWFTLKIGDVKDKYSELWENKDFILKVNEIIKSICEDGKTKSDQLLLIRIDKIDNVKSMKY